MRELPRAFAARCVEHFDLGRLLSRPKLLARGQNNPRGVWRFETTRGPFAIKLLAARPDPAALACEHAAFVHGVPMPEPIRARDGQLIGALRLGRERQDVRAHALLTGRVCRWSQGDVALATGAGRLLARVHAVPPPAEALSMAPDPVEPFEAWLRIADDADVQSMPWARLLRHRLPLIRAVLRLIDAHPAPAPHVLSQRDLHPPNVMLQRGGALALLDWDAAGIAVASAEVWQYARVWATGPSGRVRPAAQQAFVNGYRDAGGSYAPRGQADQTPSRAALLAWVLVNLRRDLRGAGVRGLSSALLRAVGSDGGPFAKLRAG
jgi:Ser/Thr protein kinase RdoA (MazF antagonist)